MNMFDQNVPGLADLLSGQGAPAEQPTQVQGMAELVQPAQSAPPVEAPAEEKSSAGVFSSPEVKNMLLYGLMTLAKTGDVGTALQGAAIAGAGTRAEQERARKETEDRELARRKQEQDMQLRNEEMGMRREDLGLRKEEMGMRKEEMGIKRENYASEREYRAAQTAKVRSETSRDDDLHATTKAGLQAKIDFVKQQVAASKDAMQTEKLRRRQLTLENAMKEIEKDAMPAQTALKTRKMEIDNEAGQTGIAAANVGIEATKAGIRGKEIANEGGQIANAKAATELDIFLKSPETLQRQSVLGLKGTAAVSEQKEFENFLTKNAKAYVLEDGGLDVARASSDFNRVKNGSLLPEQQLKMKSAARAAVPIGAPYIDPVTGQTAIRRN